MGMSNMERRDVERMKEAFNELIMENGGNESGYQI